MIMFKITEEEINKILLDSPATLPNSPGEMGMKASVVKPFFYKFINTFIGILNKHFENLFSEISSRVNLHNENDSAHPHLLSEIQSLRFEADDIWNQLFELSNYDEQIKELIVKTVKEHNDSTDEEHHPYLQNFLQLAFNLADNAYSLALAKSKIRPFDSVANLVNFWMTEVSNVGDVFITIEPNIPDFTLISKGEEYNGADVLFTGENYENISFEAGKVYYLENESLRLGATDGGYDHSKLALKADFEKLVKEVESKENARGYVSEILETVQLESLKEFNLGTRSSIILTLPENIADSFDVIINFHSGAVATTFDAPDEIYFTQDDCLGGHLYPISNRIYEINIKNAGGFLIAKVSSCDYEVIL